MGPQPVGATCPSPYEGGGNREKSRGKETTKKGKKAFLSFKPEFFISTVSLRVWKKGTSRDIGGEQEERRLTVSRPKREGATDDMGGSEGI